MDQGSDGWCAQYYLKSIGIRVCTFPDDAHRRWNNAQAALKEPPSSEPRHGAHASNCGVI